jgi:hypothetical protein
MMVSAPRISSTRPLAPVRTVAPGFSTVSADSAAGCAPGASIQTSPEDLLTRQAASCAVADELVPAARKAISKSALDNDLMLLNIGGLTRC